MYTYYCISAPPQLFHSRQPLHFCKSFNRSLHFLLQDWLHEFPDSLPIILSIPVFSFFSVFPLFSCWFRAVDWVGSCQFLIARQSSISYRIVAATHGLWSRIRQVAPLCIILRFLGPTRVCPFKRHMDRFGGFVGFAADHWCAHRRPQNIRHL